MFIKKNLSNFLMMLDAVRYWDWYYIARVNLFAVLLLFVFHGNILFFLPEIILYILYVHAALALGFLINNYADREIDSKVGKSYLHSISEKTLRTFIVSTFLYLLFVPLYLNNLGIFVIVLISLFLGLGYSLRPIRFKERGILGILAPMIAQHLSFLFFIFILPGAFTIVLYLFGWLVLDGILLELEQQAGDYENDRATGTKTLLSQISILSTRKIVFFFMIVYTLYMLLPIITLSLPGITLSLLLFVFSSISFNHGQRSIAHLNQRQ